MARQVSLWKGAAAVVAVALLSSGAAGALDSDSAPAPLPESRGVLAPNLSTTYVPLTPCRIFSTTATGNKVGADESRSARVSGNLSSQGGQAAGCGVPAAAVAIEASITATFVEGPGYVRAWPAATPEPQATLVNYTPAGASTSTGALSITSGGGIAFVLKNYRSRSHIIVDVQGYYVRPAFAMVRSNGAVERHNGVSNTSKLGAGQYIVNFTVNTDNCSRLVTVGRVRSSDPTSSGFASVHANATQLHVQTYDTSGNLADRAFLLEVTC